MIWWQTTKINGNMAEQTTGKIIIIIKRLETSFFSKHYYSHINEFASKIAVTTKKIDQNEIIIRTYTYIRTPKSSWCARLFFYVIFSFVRFFFSLFKFLFWFCCFQQNCWNKTSFWSIVVCSQQWVWWFGPQVGVLSQCIKIQF